LVFLSKFDARAKIINPAAGLTPGKNLGQWQKLLMKAGSMRAAEKKCGNQKMIIDNIIFLPQNCNILLPLFKGVPAVERCLSPEDQGHQRW